MKTTHTTPLDGLIEGEQYRVRFLSQGYSLLWVVATFERLKSRGRGQLLETVWRYQGEVKFVRADNLVKVEKL